MDTKTIGIVILIGAVAYLVLTKTNLLSIGKPADPPKGDVSVGLGFE